MKAFVPGYAQTNGQRNYFLSVLGYLKAVLPLLLTLTLASNLFLTSILPYWLVIRVTKLLLLELLFLNPPMLTMLGSWKRQLVTVKLLLLASMKLWIGLEQ